VLNLRRRGPSSRSAAGARRAAVVRRVTEVSSLASSYRGAALAVGRFLPPDPRTTEPYRFTPQLALRSACSRGWR
jgi:hypothetical protein